MVIMRWICSVVLEFHGCSNAAEFLGIAAVMKVENYDELDKMYDKIKRKIKNKKLAKKTYKKQVKQKSMMIEFAIQGYMDQYNVSYEEAQGFIYNQLRKKDVPKPQRLMIDGTAKL